MSDVIIPTSPSGTSERSAKLETRAEHLFLKCTYCDGSGEPYDGVECPECFGFGTEQTPVFPITLEDLDEITDAVTSSHDSRDDSSSDVGNKTTPRDR